MATSVKMDDEAKSHLERLQAGIWLKTGTRVTRQEVLARLIENAVRSKTDLIDSFRGGRVPFSASERERFRDGMVSSGVMTTEEDIGDMLYG